MKVRVNSREYPVSLDFHYEGSYRLEDQTEIRSNGMQIARDWVIEVKSYDSVMPSASTELWSHDSSSHQESCGCRAVIQKHCVV